MFAARRGTSVSQLVAAQLTELVKRENGYERARKRALKRLSEGFDLNWRKPVDRGDIYER